MDYLHQFICKICEEKFDMQYKSQKRGKICVYCAGELKEESNKKDKNKKKKY